MSNTDPSKPDHFQSEFESLSQEPQRGMMGEFVDFLGENRKWWMLPMIIVFGLMGALLLLSGTAIAPFIYTLF
jgi:hypothetical protein